VSRARWETYLYQGTTVLVNKAGIQEQVKLDSFEREVTALRLAELRLQPAEPTFDLAHMQEIHRRVFQDVYDWAGQLREVNLEKGVGTANTRFTKLADLKDHAATIAMSIREGRLLKGAPLVQRDFADEMGSVYAALNDLHPFREGNGRMTREFMTQLAEAAGYSLDFKKVDRRKWNEAATQASHGDSKPISDVFHAIASPAKAHDMAIDSRRSETTLRASLADQGYSLVERSGDQDRQYIGPVVAASHKHVAQDVGRRRAVIHELRALDKAPCIGERIAVHFRSGLGSVMNTIKPGLEMGR
jgi:fido (protein-threonine AMPylation protein)